MAVNVHLERHKTWTELAKLNEMSVEQLRQRVLELQRANDQLRENIERMAKPEAQ